MNESSPSDSVSRRHLLRTTLSAGAVVAAAGTFAAPLATAVEDAPQKATKKRIRQSLVSWCYMAAGDKWNATQLCGHARDLGCESVELIGPEHWDTLVKYGLKCAIASNGIKSGPGFMRGLNNPAYQDEVLTCTKETIDKCAQYKVPSVIAFTGYKWKKAEDPKSGEIPKEECAQNTIAALKELAAYGEKKGVTICLEHLNSRDDTHPMKGHPGYQGDDLDYVAEIVKAVGSPRVKILFDIYHVQIMNGDVIRRIGQYHELIGHVHTAGCPGRGELDDQQEINYPPIMRKLIEVGYQGYVGQEFIPTRDALAGLRQAVTLCDV